MIDFNKRLNNKDSEKKINPIEIYDSLDRIAEKGPLRPAQESILTEWHNDRRKDKDTIIKLHTGQGKTLIGLLILQSYLNEGKGPVLYVCPNIYLVDQTCDQAKQFGIEYTRIEADGSIPDDFGNSKSILIVHVQKVFNGRTIFKLGNRSISVDAIVLDDSHACIDTIESAAKLEIPVDHVVYDRILDVFEYYLEEQGYAKLAEIKSGDSYEVMPVPYWAWFDRSKDIADVLVEYINDNKVKFSWPLLRDDIENCYCLISSTKIEILPYRNPIEQFGTFAKAKHRILMSATTNNDAFFIKGLGVEKKYIVNPLVYQNERWSGEKMIIIPFHIDEQLNRTAIVNWWAKPIENRKFGVVVLTPSYKDAQFWESCGAEIATSSNLSEVIEKLKKGDAENTIVFNNRYDGIDLPDNSCRVLIIDKRPYSQTLFDIYQEEVRENSDLINIKVAQKIEQGLGRGVRGEKDFCGILFTGANLISAIKDKRVNQFFSPQTREQIKIGIELTSYAVEDAKENNGANIVIGAMKQCLGRDAGWKAFYQERMDNMKMDITPNGVLDILALEREAEIHYINGEYRKSEEKIQKIVNEFTCDETERGWYLQEMARYIYPLSKIDSNQHQITAHKKNRYLLKPISGMNIEKLEIKQDRVEKIKNWISSFNHYVDLKIELDRIFSNLNFGSRTKQFEKSLEEIGHILGFASERPEQTWKSGPDNLWGIGSNEYFVIECKSGVKDNRANIYKGEAEQLHHSKEWFKRNYTHCECYTIMIINTKAAERGVFLPEGSLIMTKNKLYNLKSRIRDFMAEFKDVNLNTISDSKLNQLLEVHKLNKPELLGLMEEVYYSK